MPSQPPFLELEALILRGHDREAALAILIRRRAGQPDAGAIETPQWRPSTDDTVSRLRRRA